MKNLLSSQDAEETGMDELRSVLENATTEDMRSMLVNNVFETERELTINLMVAAIWNVNYSDLARMCNISIEAAKGIQEMAMKEIAQLKVLGR